MRDPGTKGILPTARQRPRLPDRPMKPHQVLVAAASFYVIRRGSDPTGALEQALARVEMGCSPTLDSAIEAARAALRDPTPGALATLKQSAAALAKARPPQHKSRWGLL